MTAELVAEHTSVQPNGSTRLGVYFRIEDGWHIYAKDPGDAGLPTKVTWRAAPAVSFGSLIWPPAEPFHDPGDMTTYGYRGSLLLSSSMTYAPLLFSNSEQGYPDLSIRADVEWLSCKDVCIPGKVHLELQLPVSTNAAILSSHADLFEHTQ